MVKKSIRNWGPQKTPGGILRGGLLGLTEFFEAYDPKFATSRKKVTHTFECGEKIKMNSHRYWTFSQSGVDCVSCGIKGSHFALERWDPTHPFHLNLYGLDDHGDEVLMTKDHIVAQSKGGKNHISNYQTMCTVCNGMKGDGLDQSEYRLDYIKQRLGRHFRGPIQLTEHYWGFEIKVAKWENSLKGLKALGDFFQTQIVRISFKGDAGLTLKFITKKDANPEKEQ